MCKNLLLIFIGLLFTISVKAQLKTLYVNPDKTAANIETVHGPHVVTYGKSPGNKLFVMMVGTGAKAKDGEELCRYYAGKGYHAISIDYRNTVITTICTKSEDSTCFNNFRQEIAFGTPVSAQINVDTVNSITNRIKQLLIYLAKTDKHGNWQQFIRNNKVRWSRIALAGHSQGAGHAAFIGEKFRLKRVMIFSGPQDYLSVFDKPAGWLSDKSKTPRRRYYAFLHKKDPFNMEWQLAACKKIMRAKGDTVQVKPGAAVYSSKHIFINNIDTKNPHGSTLLPVFTQVRDKMIGLR